MPVDRFGEPGFGATYHGFSGAAPSAPPPCAGVRRPSRGALIGGVAAAVVALGLALGFAMRPDTRALSTDTAAESGVTRPMPIRVDRPAPAPDLPKPAGKLEVLNPATAEAARAAQPVMASAAPVPASSRPSAGQMALPAIEPPVLPTQRLAQAAPTGTAPAVADPLARCAGARSRAEALVCADPELGSYDRDLNRAFRRAMRSGAVSPDDLRADQRDWLDDRERAARRSPEAMAELYQQRIDELNRIADDGPGNDNSGDSGT